MVFILFKKQVYSIFPPFIYIYIFFFEFIFLKSNYVDALLNSFRQKPRNIFVISKISAAKEARGGRKPKSISSIKRQRFVQTNETVEPDRSDLDKKGSTRQD